MPDMTRPVDVILLDDARDKLEDAIALVGEVQQYTQVSTVYLLLAGAKGNLDVLMLRYLERGDRTTEELPF